jgi:hypothetical protein
MQIIGIMGPLGSPRHHSQARLVSLRALPPITDMHGGCSSWSGMLRRSSPFRPNRSEAMRRASLQACRGRKARKSERPSPRRQQHSSQEPKKLQGRQYIRHRTGQPLTELGQGHLTRLDQLQGHLPPLGTPLGAFPFPVRLPGRPPLLRSGDPREPTTLPVAIGRTARRTSL